jgi:hypothetical protein
MTSKVERLERFEGNGLPTFPVVAASVPSVALPGTTRLEAVAHVVEEAQGVG